MSLPLHEKVQKEPVVFYFHPWELDAFLPEVDLGFWQNLRSQGGKKDLHAKLARALRGRETLTLGEWAAKVRDSAMRVSSAAELPR